MTNYDAIAALEQTVRDAQKAIQRTERKPAAVEWDSVALQDLRVELDTIWNALYFLARGLDRKVPVDDEVDSPE